MIKFIQSLRILPRWIIIIIDLTILAFSVTFAYLLIYNFDFSRMEQANYFNAILIYLAGNLAAIFLTQSYAGIIRYTSFEDGYRILMTAIIGALVSLMVNYIFLFLSGMEIISLSVWIISFFNAVIFLVTYRFFVKYIFTYYNKAVQKKTAAIIFGAGESGMITKQIIDQNSTSNIKVVGFVEDDPRKANKVANGVKIYPSKELPKLLKTLKVKELIISVQDISINKKNRLVDLCLKHDVIVRTVPPSDKWVKGELSVNQIKNINIEDLLGREAINLNNINIKSELRNKWILVSGAAGSIGSEIVRQVLMFNPKGVVLVDQAESALYEFDIELRKNNYGHLIHPVIADITNKKRIQGVFEQYKPEIVFHAAAYKHVPLMENNPSEAVLCNVLGTKNLADTALQYMAERFVMISTDKAVNPTSVMGASKRIAEIYVQSLNKKYKLSNSHITSFITTRFGNVLGSNGSVIPLFKKQIQNRENITVTHPEITRYFMTIPEACQLVLEAGAIGNGGEIFIFDMGESVKIVDLAKKMIKLSGLQLGKDIMIEYTGLRAGEKLYEELLNVKENTIPTHHPKIMIAKVSEEDFDIVRERIKNLLKAAKQRDELNLVQIMKFIVPEFKSKISKFEKLDRLDEVDQVSI